MNSSLIVQEIRDAVRRHGALLIVLLGFVAFGSTLRVGFMWDDHEMIEKNPVVQNPSWAGVKHAFTHDVFDGKGDPYYRPLQTLLNMWDAQVWGIHPFGFHLTNLLLHLLNGCLLFLILRRVLEDELAAFFAAALFVVNPIIIEQLLIIAGRAELMALAFTLAATWAALETEMWAAPLAILFYAGACLSKESGIVAPAFPFLFFWYNRKTKPTMATWVGFAVVAAGYLILRRVVVPPKLNPADSAMLARFALKEFPSMTLRYIRIVLLPFDLHSHRRMVFSVAEVILSLLILLTVVVVSFILSRRLALLCLGLFFLGLFPKLPLLATNALMIDHWAYVSAIALVIPVGIFSARLTERQKAQAGLLLFVSFSVGWILLGWFNTVQRGTEKGLYQWALRFPSSSVVRYNYGLMCYQEGRYEEAERLFAASLTMEPTSALTANALALTWWKEGKPERALQLLSDWIRRQPQFVPSWINRATIERGDQAIDDVDQAIKIDPNHESAWILKAELEYERHDLKSAEQCFLKAVDVNPRNADVWADLGSLAAQRGDLVGAQKYWRRAADIDPTNLRAVKNLMWLDSLGRRSSAH